MGNRDIVKVFQSPGSLPEREAKIHPHSKTKGHDMGIMFPKPEGRSILGERIQSDTKEIRLEFPVNVVEFVFILSVIFLQVFFIDFFEIMEIERAFRINTFVDHKVFAVFLMNEGMTTMRTPEIQGRKTIAIIGRESGITNLAEHLSFCTIVFIKKN